MSNRIFFLDFILPSQNTIDVFFVADMGLFYQRNEPQDPYITYSVSHIKLYFTIGAKELNEKNKVHLVS